MGLTFSQLSLGTTIAQVQAATSGGTPASELMLSNAGTVNAYIGGSSTATSTNAFPIKPNDPPFRLVGASATAAIWAISTAPGQLAVIQK